MSNFKRVVLAEWAERRRSENEAAEARRQEQETSTRSAFIKDFGVEPDEVHGSLATADGITLRRSHANFDARAHWVVRGLCPKCGEIADSPPCYYQAQVGQFVEDWRPDYDHRCKLAVSEPSIAEQPAELIRRFVREEA